MGRRSYKLSDGEAKRLVNPPCPKCGGRTFFVVIPQESYMGCHECGYREDTGIKRVRRGRPPKVAVQETVPAEEPVAAVVM